jgi:hypothetical protein
MELTTLWVQASLARVDASPETPGLGPQQRTSQKNSSDERFVSDGSLLVGDPLRVARQNQVATAECDRLAPEQDQPGTAAWTAWTLVFEKASLEVRRIDSIDDGLRAAVEVSIQIPLGDAMRRGKVPERVHVRPMIEESRDIDSNHAATDASLFKLGCLI